MAWQKNTSSAESERSIPLLPQLSHFISDEEYSMVKLLLEGRRLKKANHRRKLVRIGFECYVARSYEQGKLTLQEAARLVKLTHSETIDVDVLSETGVKGNIRSSEVLESFIVTR